MSNYKAFPQDVPEQDLARLIRVGATVYEAPRKEAEERLGAALWEIVDLECSDTDSSQVVAEGDYPHDVMHSREAQIGPRILAVLEFQVPSAYRDIAKASGISAWLKHMRTADLSLDVFEHDLPHNEDSISQALISMRPYGQAELHRDAPYTLTTASQEGAALSVPDVETTILILGKIAAEYPGKNTI